MDEKLIRRANRVEIISRWMRLGREFPTEETLELYLEQHPKADKKKHWIKKVEETTEEEKPEEEKLKKSPKEKPKNDYSQENVGIKQFRGNMNNNLEFVARSDIEETKNTSTDPISKDNVDQFTESMVNNVSSVMKKYGTDLLSPETNKRLASQVANTFETVQEAVKDGSLGDVSQADLDEYLREDMKRLIHQEIETKQRSLGDHGIRHVVSNASNTYDMLSKLKDSGVKITGRDMLMALSIQSNHDIGYTVGDSGADAAKGGAHKDNTRKVLDEEKDRYQKIFGDDSDKFIEIAHHHDSPEIDWKNEPVASSVRLADNLSLFGQDKVQDLFIRSPKAMKMAGKLRLAIEAKKPEAIQSIVDNLHSHIDQFEDASETDKKLLHGSIDEMTKTDFGLNFTVKDILARYSGRLKGFSYDAENDEMDVEMAYVPESEMLDELFGDELSAKKFNSFAEDMGADSPIGKKSEINFGGKGGKVKVNINGIDEEPENQKTSEAFSEIVEKTARSQLNHAAFLISPPPEESDMDSASKYLQSQKDRFSDSEWKNIEEALGSGKKPEEIASVIRSFPVTEKELAYLMEKEASLAFRRGRCN